MENEIWKEIPGYKGLYEVSNYGQIKSIERLEKCGNKTRIRKARILKQSLALLRQRVLRRQSRGRIAQWKAH